MKRNTPGPWVVFHADENGANDVLPAMRPGFIARDIESTADAHLIAAAPEMLDALFEIAGGSLDPVAVDIAQSLVLRITRTPLSSGTQTAGEQT